MYYTVMYAYMLYLEVWVYGLCGHMRCILRKPSEPLLSCELKQASVHIRRDGLIFEKKLFYNTFSFPFSSSPYLSPLIISNSPASYTVYFTSLLPSCLPSCEKRVSALDYYTTQYFSLYKFNR